MSEASPTIKVTTQPTTEPLTIDELKNRLRITGCDFDNELQDLLKAARIAVEDQSYRKLITQTVEIHYDDFPGTFGDIEIRLAPISAITHVKYYDQDDTLSTVSSSDYYTDLTTTPPRIALKQSKSWPITSLARPNRVVVTMTAGYGAASAVPAAAKLAIVEYVKSVRNGCDGAGGKFKDLLSQIQWTSFHKVSA
jgi:uncharacterized phiE125 gp8 family phage protein